MGAHERLRRWIARPVFAPAVDLRGRRIIVTGCTPGSLGFETARTLLSWGADVTVTTRTAPERTAADLQAAVATIGGHGAVEADTLDLADAASVARFTEAFRNRHAGKLDVLVNNAGIHLDLLSQATEPLRANDGHEIHWRTNYLGTLHLTLRLLPLLLANGRDSGDARVVNVSSRLHNRGGNAGLFTPPEKHDSWVAYGLSKLALNHASFELHRRYGGSAGPLRAYCLHPGAVYTHIAGKGLAGSPRIARARAALAPVETLFLRTPAEGAQTQIYCASHPTAAGGHYYRSCAVAQPTADCADTGVASRLYDQTVAWVDRLG